MDTKTCPCCDLDLPVKHFYSNGEKRCYRCKTCEKNKIKKSIKRLKLEGLNICKICGETKRLEEFAGNE